MKLTPGATYVLFEIGLDSTYVSLKGQDSIEFVVQLENSHSGDPRANLNALFWRKEEADKLKIKYKKYWKDILSGTVAIGWDKNLCRMSWGEPDDINTTTKANGTTEQWVYASKSFLYFENGKLTTIQN